jgi:hypothetical protein
MSHAGATPTEPHIPRRGEAVIPMPSGGWTWETYERAVEAFVRVRGQAPRTITMHPETLEALWCAPHPHLTVAERKASSLTFHTPNDHPRDTIVLA